MHKERPAAEALDALADPESISDLLTRLGIHFEGLHNDPGKAKEAIFYADSLPFAELGAYAAPYTAATSCPSATPSACPGTPWPGRRPRQPCPTTSGNMEGRIVAIGNAGKPITVTLGGIAVEAVVNPKVLARVLVGPN